MKRNGKPSAEGEDEAPQAPRSSAAGARIEKPKAPRGLGCGKGCPLPTGEGAGEGLCPPPRKIFDFGSQYGLFWCILDGIFTVQLPVLHAKL